ncbi:MAG: hypothetical protein U0792_11430 [Gemmataceae bacterium]
MLRLVSGATVATALVVVLVGCEAEPSRVKGRLLENGKPVAVPAAGSPQVIVFESMSPDGATSTGRMYSAMLSTDGTFELIASGGSVPPGNYRVSFDVTLPGKDGDKFKGFRRDNSPIRRELKPGSNDLTIDLASPEK